MKSFKSFLIEENEIVPMFGRAITPETQDFDHRKHPMGQFLSFMREELPFVETEDLNTDQMFREEFGKRIDQLIGDDPSHFHELHKDLKTESEEIGGSGPTLEDVLYRITRQVAENTHRRYKNEVLSFGVPSEEMSDIIKRFRSHMSERAEKLIQSKVRGNPKWRHITGIEDIKI